MDTTFDIPDSTDWLDTPLKDFSTLENALHCEICKEFYDTPMLTSCSHTFCSKCIRTALSTDGRCPSCRTSDQASKLRNNLALQEIVARFLFARPKALEVARREMEQAEQAKRPGKRKRIVLDSDDVSQAEQDGRTTRSKSRKLAASQTSEPEVIEVDDSEGDHDFEPEPELDDGLVECPLGCGKRMKIEAVEPHLDRCEDERRQASRAKSRTPTTSLVSSRPPSAQSMKPPDRINELNYSLLNDSKLRTKLRELGISDTGSKQLMIKRHTEWVNLWNANCDSKTPRPKRDLLRELDTWERTQGGRAPNTNGLSSGIMRKDFDGLAWVNKNKDDFSRLIAEAQRRKNNPAIEPERPKDVGMVDGTAKSIPDAETEVSSSLPPSTSQSSPPPPNRPEPAKPYENNPKAISSIRAKVEAANAGQHIEPVMNAGFESTPVNGTHIPAITVTSNAEKRAEPPPGPTNPALLEQNHFGRLSRNNSMDEHAINVNSSSQCDWSTHKPSSPVKLPMFAIPQQPFNDVDGADGGFVEH